MSLVGDYHSEYKIYLQMKRRCTNPAAIEYPSYGGRGISVEFDSFADFLKEVGPRPSKNHSVDRIDNDGNYAPGNLRWATKLEQQNNMRSNRMLTFNGKTQSVAMWARETGLHRDCLRSRLRLGWSPQKTLTTPLGARRGPRRNQPKLSR